MKTDDLSDAIMAELIAYGGSVDSAMQDEIEKMAQDVKETLASDPVIPKKTGGYRRGFYVKRLAQGKGFKRMVVANKKYQLTHLLETGHITKTGGRTRAYPHWEKAQKMAETLDQRVREAIQK